MEQRERLIELIEETEDKYIECIRNSVEQRIDFGEFFADRLLAEGVIVPPCKVGDTVYIVDGTTDGIVEGKIINIEFNIYTTPREWITVIGNYPFFGKHEEKNRIDLLIGKTVFLSREEAEKALAEKALAERSG
jgi:acetyltransferase-like isoleucine patch superfamily enzyme